MLKKREVLVVVFLTIAIPLYCLFIFFSQDVPYIELEYLGMILCFVFSLLFNGHYLDTWLVRIGLFFTLLADTFLLLLYGYELIGVAIFCMVQLIYGIRLLIMSDGKLKINTMINIRLAIILIFQVVGLFIDSKFNLLLFISLFYFANLVTNVLLSFIFYKRNPLFANGLLFFLFCDIFVGLNNSQILIDLSSNSLWYKLLHLPIDLMWFFYYPSQVLITLSILNHPFNNLD